MQSLAAFFTLTVFLSSALLFCVQPMCGKMLLPSLGGSPAVWNTCMLFFQAALLAGYAYVHAASRNVRSHAVVHLALLALALWFLPIEFMLTDPSEANPVFWLLGVLVTGVGVPFLALSAGAPLLQRWFAAIPSPPDTTNPYFLYAASNLGSLLALLGYPFLIEPNLSLEQQRLYWKWLFVVVLAMSAGCAFLMWRRKGAGGRGQGSEREGSAIRSAGEKQTAPDPSPLTPAPSPLMWLLLALVPSSLMLSVTSYVTTDIAAVPLLWVVPLAIYLLTFVIAFSGNRPGLRNAFVRWAPLVVLILVLIMLLEAKQPALVIVAIHFLGLFWLAMVCHGELASTRPSAEHLTGFYLWIAVGGLLGGVFNALIAPLIFNRIAEYPLMLVAVCLLLPAAPGGSAERTLKALGWDAAIAAGVGLATAAVIWLVQRDGRLPPGQMSVAVVFAPALLIAYLLHQRPVRFGLAIAAILLASLTYHGVYGRDRYVQRSFFGVHRVTQDKHFRFLVHGSTRHGQQSLNPEKRGTPLMYYYPSGPIGQVIAALKDDERLQRVGLVGLGCGALAAYSEPGQHWSFFEIDPAVVHIARDAGWFTYLHDARGRCDVQLGDGRLLLKKSNEKFGLIVIDAFSSDSIPLHLLTREALRLYRSRLVDNGVLAFHISNDYLDLKPVLARLARDAGSEWMCLYQNDTDIDFVDTIDGKAGSEWAVITSDRAFADKLRDEGRWTALEADPALPVWTDDYSNLFSVFRWE